MTDKPDPLDLDALKDQFIAAIGIKGRMKAKGLRLGKCTCPRCGEKTCVAALAGPRDHLHMQCACGFAIME